MPNMFITKANAEENRGGEGYLPFHYESSCENKSPDFIWSHVCEDGSASSS